MAISTTESELEGANRHQSSVGNFSGLAYYWRQGQAIVAN